MVSLGIRLEMVSLGVILYVIIFKLSVYVPNCCSSSW